MTNIEKLQEQMTLSQLLITDTKHIEYYIDTLYHVDERFIGLYIPKVGEASLILNALFNSPSNVEVVLFNDGDDITKIITSLCTNETLGVDGNAKLRFILPLIDSGLKVVDCSHDLNYVRAIKDSHEIQMMQDASNRNDHIMEQLKSKIKYGISELYLTQIAIDLQSQEPQTGPSFDPIVVFTENAADPHGSASDRKLVHGDTVLIDMGGMLNGYASDMTRVYFTDENSKLKEIYNVVLEANKAAIAAIKPGVRFSDVDQAARDVITKAGYGEYFTHRTGHGIGRETHEPLDVSSSNHNIIENGMCFSIEPGIYIKDFGGIRIEDLVCIQNNEVIVLNHVKKDFDDVVLDPKKLVA